MTMAPAEPLATRADRWPLVLVTSLFFMWGLSYGLLDVLNKHFQDQLSVSKAESGWLQFSYFGAYFLIALPAGLFMERFGYKRGILLGLGLYLAGALLFIPATAAGRFAPFLLALFVIASGAACLETAANPYITVLGPAGAAERRLNLAQSFNGLGSFLGPLIGGLFFFGRDTAAVAENAASVRATYLAIAVSVSVLAVAVWRSRLPEAREPVAGDEPPRAVASTSAADTDAANALPLHRRPHCVAGIVTQFFYVGAQVGIAAFFINAATEQWPELGVHRASFLLSLGLVAFTLGRFVGTALMRRLAPARLLVVYGSVALALCAVVAAGVGMVSVAALVTIFFFESIMFPTIFALGLKGLGAKTKRAASLQVMSIIGGALMPAAMGAVADRHGTATAYVLPAMCFAVVVWFGWRGHRLPVAAVGKTA